MRVLFDNIAENATITGSNESLNYPSVNLVDPILKRRYQANIGQTSGLVTLSFASPYSTADCFFVAFHNLTEYKIEIYDQTDTKVVDETVTTPEDIDVLYFTSVSQVKTVNLTFTLSGNVPFVGGIGLGEYYGMPDPLANFPTDYTDNSNFISSVAGATLQNFVKPLRKREYNFRDNTLTIKNEVNAKYVSIGVGKAIYFDFFEENRDIDAPLYGKLTDTTQSGKIDRRYNFSLIIEEAR